MTPKQQKAYEELKQQREKYIPAGFVHTRHEELKLSVYEYFTGDFIAVIFRGRQAKFTKGHKFKTENERAQYINSYVMNQQEVFTAIQAQKLARKIQQEKDFKSIKPGDIFHQGGGYDQTNCHFYQLISLKGKTGTFRSISYDSVPGSEGFMRERRTPDKDNFTGKEFTARITGDFIKPGYDRAYKVEPGQDFYCSWYA